MLVSKDLTFTYDNSKVFHFPNITLEKGEHLLVLGESGIGKTTLIQLLAGLLTAHSGELLINGTDITTLNSSQLDRFRGKHVGMVFQKPYFVRNIRNIYLFNIIDIVRCKRWFFDKKIGITFRNNTSS